jgi:methyl-accepting chemotaxis protein
MQIKPKLQHSSAVGRFLLYSAAPVALAALAVAFYFLPRMEQAFRHRHRERIEGLVMKTVDIALRDYAGEGDEGPGPARKSEILQQSGYGACIDDIRGEFTGILAGIGATLSLALLAIAGIGAMMIRSRARALKEINCAVLNICEGEPSAPEAKSPDDSAPVLENFNGMITEFSSLAERVSDSSDQLTDSSREISGKSEALFENAKKQVLSVIDISASIEAIAAGIDEVAVNAKEQAEGLHTLVHLIRGLMDSADTLGGKIEDAVSTAQAVAEHAIHGQEVLNDTAREMIRVIRDSQAINEVLDVINDISDKINLLSLNAAIEAARAGESGRGFAVVADEISKLADMTASSVRNIGGMLEEKNRMLESNAVSIQGAVKSAGDVMDRIQHISQEIKKVSNTIRDQVKLNQIVVNEAMKTCNKSEDIDNATTEQKVAIYDVLNNVNGINSLFKENVVISREYLKTAGTIAEISRRIKDMVAFIRK